MDERDFDLIEILGRACAARTSVRTEPVFTVDGPDKTMAKHVERYINTEWHRKVLTCYVPERYDLGGYE